MNACKFISCTCLLPLEYGISLEIASSTSFYKVRLMEVLLPLNSFSFLSRKIFFFLRHTHHKAVWCWCHVKLFHHRFMHNHVEIWIQYPEHCTAYCMVLHQSVSYFQNFFNLDRKIHHMQHTCVTWNLNSSRLHGHWHRRA